MLSLTKISSSRSAVFAEHPDWKVVTTDKETLPGELATADAILVRSATFVDAAMMDKAPKLRVIGRAGVGVDNVDLDAATKRGIVVMNTPGGNAVAVAEHTFALMLVMARHLTRADSTMQAGKWEKKTLQGTELRGKTLGIVGLGRVGVEVSRRAQAFGMKVIAHDPYVAPTLAAAVERHPGSARRTLCPVGLHHAARRPDAANHRHDQRRHAAQDEEGRAAG